MGLLVKGGGPRHGGGGDVRKETVAESRLYGKARWAQIVANRRHANEPFHRRRGERRASEPNGSDPQSRRPFGSGIRKPVVTLPRTNWLRDEEGSHMRVRFKIGDGSIVKASRFARRAKNSATHWPSIAASR